MTEGKRSGPASSQAEMPLIVRKVENRVVEQRATDGYINATAMCTAAGRPWSRYWETKRTQMFMAALSVDTGIPTSKLIEQFRGRPAHLQGTWVHPQVAISLAQWLSPKFEVQVTKWVFEWMSGHVIQRAAIPDHIRRYLVNQHRIPGTHFSMLHQMIFRLLAPLEREGYILPDEYMPDISLGRMFSRWLRENGHSPDSFPAYQHEFIDHRRTVEARLYPNEVMTEFNQQLDNWLRDGRARKYFGDRDENAIMPLDRVLSALPAPSSDDLPTLGTGDGRDE